MIRSKKGKVDWVDIIKTALILYVLYLVIKALGFIK